MLSYRAGGGRRVGLRLVVSNRRVIVWFKIWEIVELIVRVIALCRVDLLLLW